MATAQQWCEFVANDLETYPADGALIEIEYENGARAQASFQRGGGGIISLISASSEITGGTDAKKWRYLRLP